MKIKLLLSGIFFLLISTNIFSQTSLNNYKYVIVPDKFDFLNEKNQYRINELAEFLFNKYGFTALTEGEDYPEDLTNNRCLALKSDLLKESKMFKTRLKIELKDCNDRLVYVSNYGESREKEYETAYVEAVRATFKHLEALNYAYEPNTQITSISTSTTTNQNSNNTKVVQEIKDLKEEIENLKKEKTEVIKAQEVIVSEIKEKEETKVVASNVLYAQETSNGFQLVDSSPKVVYKIKNTGLNDVFLVENKSAIIYKKEDKWIIEFYSGDSLKSEVLNIKF